MQSGRRNAEMGLELDVSGVKIKLEISKKYVSINICCDII